MMIAAALLMEMQPTHALTVTVRPQSELAMQDRHCGNRIVAHLRARAGLELFRRIIADHLYT